MPEWCTLQSLGGNSCKRLCLCQSVVLGILLYSAETWTPTQVLVKKLETFHHHYVRCIMGIGRAVQWAESITTTQLTELFGMQESVSILLSVSRLRWLGHVVHMPDNCIPTLCLDGSQGHNWLMVKTMLAK